MNFSALPPDIRRALARRELRRRGVPIRVDEVSTWAIAARFMSRAAVTQLEPLLSEPRAADGQVSEAAAATLRGALIDARKRMLSSRQPAPPAPPMSDWSAWRDHTELFGQAPASDEDLAAVDGLLAALVETCAGAAWA